MSGKNIALSSAKQNGQSTRSIASKMYEDDEPQYKELLESKVLHIYRSSQLFIPSLKPQPKAA